MAEQKGTTSAARFGDTLAAPRTTASYGPSCGLHQTPARPRGCSSPRHDTPAEPVRTTPPDTSPPPSSQSNPDRRLYAVPFWSATAGSTGRFSGGLLRRRSQYPVVMQNSKVSAIDGINGRDSHLPALPPLAPERRGGVPREPEPVQPQTSTPPTSNPGAARRRTPSQPPRYFQTSPDRRLGRVASISSLRPFDVGSTSPVQLV